MKTQEKLTAFAEWNQFLQTGAVEDYMLYKRRQQWEEQKELFGYAAEAKGSDLKTAQYR